MNNNHEKRIPKFCVDTNVIYYLTDLELKDAPFYIEAINSDSYRYIANPFTEFPKLRYFEQTNDFSSPEFKEYTRQMRIERTTVKELLDRRMLFPEMFKGVKRKDLPDLIANTYFGHFQDNKMLNRQTYSRLHSYNYLLKYLKEGKVNLFITDTTLEEVREAITDKGKVEIQKFMDLSLVKPITFSNKKKHSKFLKKVEALLKKYNRSKFISSIQEHGQRDLAIFAESSTLMLDLVSENVGHFISKNRTKDKKEYEISDEFQTLNYESGCFYYRNMGGEKFIGVAPKILTVIDLVRYIKHNEQNHESIRGLQETEVTPSGLVW